MNYRFPHHHGGGWMGGWGGWGFGLVALGALVLLVLIVVLMALIYRRQSSHQSVAAAGASPMRWAPPPPEAGREPGPDAARILGERYARGEIDDEEYQRRLNMLRGPGPQ
ncbi:putative membrane protein [Kitasatospora sp. MAA4]|uniref:SHOCT domain-containing protein n=1 Tax=Kitasatospora sp. MAA4 TaxID=3035093 RepID=UPI0024748D3F|nr:SHOCT domain-containing protein [Kitasatospora sp. MAA4]MDH6133241.1 putative membrane protein [Kitasatospora sp. MAA4]